MVMVVNYRLKYTFVALYVVVFAMLFLFGSDIMNKLTFPVSVVKAPEGVTDPSSTNVFVGEDTVPINSSEPPVRPYTFHDVNTLGAIAVTSTVTVLVVPVVT